MKVLSMQSKKKNVQKNLNINVCEIWIVRKLCRIASMFERLILYTQIHITTKIAPTMVFVGRFIARPYHQ